MEFRHFGELAIDAVIVGDVAGDHLEEIVDLSAHAIEFHDFGDFGYTVRENLKPVIAMLGGAYCDDYRYAETKAVAIEDGDPSFDDAVLFKSLDPLPAGRGGQAYLLGDIRHGERCIILKKGKNAAVCMI